MQYMVGRTARRAGITRPDPTQTISPHKLRHTFASRLVEKGADLVAVRDLMGHSKLSTTAIYLHADLSRLRAATSLL
jgi:integrase/recombinase XerD